MAMYIEMIIYFKSPTVLCEVVRTKKRQMQHNNILEEEKLIELCRRKLIYICLQINEGSCMWVLVVYYNACK